MKFKEKLMMIITIKTSIKILFILILFIKIKNPKQKKRALLNQMNKALDKLQNLYVLKQP